MNLLKIFTYSGILEVFIIPHLLPCIQGLLPTQFVDMVQLGIGFVSELLPRVTINVDSEVFLRVWKDDTEDPAAPPASIKSRIDDPSFSGTSSNDSSSLTDGKGPGSSNIGSDTCGGCSSSGNQSSSNTAGGSSKSKDDEDCVNHSFTGSIATDCEFIKRASSIVVTSKPNVYMQYPSRYVCSVEDNTTMASAPPDHLDTFCRSCSVEYQVKPPVPETNSETPQATTLTPKPYPVSEKVSKEETDSQFCTSCSLEYVTKLNETSANDSKATKGNSKITDSKKSFSSDIFNADLAACKFLDFTNRHNAFSENLEAKAIYFGRNYKDL